MYELNCRWFLLIAVKFPKSTGRDQDDQAILATGVSISKDKISFAPRWSTHTHKPTNPHTYRPTASKLIFFQRGCSDVRVFHRTDHLLVKRKNRPWRWLRCGQAGRCLKKKNKIAEGLWFSCKLMMFLSWILIYFPELSGESSLGCPGNCVFLGKLLLNMYEYVLSIHVCVLEYTNILVGNTLGDFSRRRKFLMNFCWNFVEICAFCIWFASGTASTRACRVDQLNIKQQCAATREQLFTFSLDVVRGCRRQEQSEPLEGDRWQEQLTTARGFGAWGAQWHVDLLRWLLCPIGKGKNSWKGLGSSVCKDVQVIRSFYKTYQRYAIKASSLPSMLEDGTFKL